MSKSDRGLATDEASIMLSLLQAVERQNNITQRTLADELGVAVGLINAYVKRGVKRGLIKVQQVPKRRFAYYLTPQGFAEKSRLAAVYVSSSFDFFRKARRDCEAATQVSAQRGWHRLVLVGASDLAEVAIICATESATSWVGVVDPRLDRLSFHGLPVWSRLEDAVAVADAALITSLDDPAGAYERAAKVFGADRVIVPALLASTIAPPVKRARELSA
jgi:DNA-binding MarR family transcriptional regulator